MAGGTLLRTTQNLPLHDCSVLDYRLILALKDSVFLGVAQKLASWLLVCSVLSFDKPCILVLSTCMLDKTLCWFHRPSGYNSGTIDQT